MEEECWALLRSLRLLLRPPVEEGPVSTTAHAAGSYDIRRKLDAETERNTVMKSILLLSRYIS